MKILCVNGSPRREGNTAALLTRIEERCAAEGIEVQHAFLNDFDLAPCGACMICAKTGDGRCHGVDDQGNELIEMSRQAAGIVLGSPVYFGSVTAQIKMFMDRVGFVSRVNGGFLSRKVGAAVAVARRAGHLLTFAELNMWFLINGMIVPGSSYWNVATALEEGEARDDQEAVRTIDQLADNLTWLLKKTQ